MGGYAVAEGFAASTTGRRDFATRYGVMESIEKIPDEDNACTRTAKSDVRLVRNPGASPLVFCKFLMASTAFVTLDDIANYLPSYEESVIEVEMDETLGRTYEHVEKDIREAVAANRGDHSVMSLMMHRYEWLLVIAERGSSRLLIRQMTLESRVHEVMATTRRLPGHPLLNTSSSAQLYMISDGGWRNAYRPYWRDRPWRNGFLLPAIDFHVCQ